MFDDFPTARLAFQRLGHLLAELAQSHAAALAAGTGRGRDDALDRKIVRQLARPTRRAGALLLRRSGRRDLGFGLFLALRLFEIFDRQFELFDQEFAAFGRLTERLATRLGQQELQPLDLQRANLRFASFHDQHLALREDHRVSAGEVVGELF